MLSNPDSWLAPMRKSATSIGAVCLSALATGFTGTVLAVGDPLRANVPVLTAAITACMLAATVSLRARNLPPSARLRFSIVNILMALPLTGIGFAILASDELEQFTSQSSALGWALASTLPLLTMVAAKQAHGSTVGIDPAFGGTIGVASAVLIHVARASASPFDPLWALAGFVAGALLFGGISKLPPQPPQCTPIGTTWRSCPSSAAFVMAIITAFPAAPRHELATSSSAQILAITIASLLLMISITLWWGEGIPVHLALWNKFRMAVRQVVPTLTVLTLLTIGGLQAASYSAVTIDDLGRFIVTAEVLATSGEFPLWGSFWILPSLPITLLISFAVLGYTYPAALAPMFLANTLLPWLIYRSSLATGTRKPIAYAVSVLAVIFPPVQIFSLGSAEPDPVFIALLAATAWAFIHTIRTSYPRYSLLVFGGLAAVMTATRPEGPLYGGILMLAALFANRSRWALGGSITFGTLLLPLVVYSLVQIGQPWPTSGEAISHTTLFRNASVIGDVTLPKLSRMMLLDDIRFPVIILVILTLFSIGSIHAWRQHRALSALPLAAIMNIAITLAIVDSSTTEIRVSLVEDFVRHRSYPMPIVAALAAAGVNALSQATKHRETLHAILRVMGIGLAVYLAAGSLYVLGKPEGFHHGPGVSSLLPAAIHVNAPELWLNPFHLPAGDWDFMSFRSPLFAWYKPYDSHGNTTGMAYQTLTGAIAALGFAALLAAAPTRLPRALQRIGETEG